MTPLGTFGVRAGRDRVAAVLTEHVGPLVARERANNIAQALAFAAADPVSIATEMLRGVPMASSAEAADVAAAVTRAWHGQPGVAEVGVANSAPELPPATPLFRGGAPEDRLALR
ncbi:MAG: hypothetical protein B7733_05085 [Myxococcales bacterium FL481]|nr:MAG: hypothetical protein B7733_05085 [Myxococcales bacterium FL481]